MRRQRASWPPAQAARARPIGTGLRPLSPRRNNSRVKLADNEDNQDSVRVTMIPDADRAVEPGYADAQAMRA